MPILYFHPGPTPNPDQVVFVCRKLPMRGPAWARDYMGLTGGFSAYPPDVRKLVEADERARQQAEARADADVDDDGQPVFFEEAFQ